MVSAGNRLGGHLSARRRILTFPQVADAEWVIVDENRPDVGDDVDGEEQRRRLRELMDSGRFTTEYRREGVVVLRRVDP